MIVLISLSLILIFLIAPVSAGWFSDFWNKVTGKATAPGSTVQCPQSKCSLTGPIYCSNNITYRYCRQINSTTYTGDAVIPTGCKWNDWAYANCASGQICKDGNCVSPYFCNDSDGGLNYSVKGTCYDDVYKQGLTDVCNGINGIEEYECVPTTYSQFPSGMRCQANLTKGINACPNGCVNGACVSSGQCTPDFNVCLNKECGSWSNGTCGNVSCGECIATHTCNALGKCVPLTNQTNCTDSDGNLPYDDYYYVKGETTGKFNHGNGNIDNIIKTYTDYCSNNHSIIENFCENASWKTGGVDNNEYVTEISAGCPYGCYNGACLFFNQTNLTNCLDFCSFHGRANGWCASSIDSCKMSGGDPLFNDKYGNEGAAFCTTEKDNTSTCCCGGESINPTYYNLSITKSGFGSGTVKSLYEYADYINCGTQCKEMFLANVTVVLRAYPSANTGLGNWYGCDRVTVEKYCIVNMNSNKNVKVTFTCGVRCFFDKLFGRTIEESSTQLLSGAETSCSIVPADCVDKSTCSVRCSLRHGKAVCDCSGYSPQIAQCHCKPDIPSDS